MTVRNLASRAAALLVVFSLALGPVALGATAKPGKTRARDEIVRSVKRVIGWFMPKPNDGTDEDWPIPPIPKPQP